MSVTSYSLSRSAGQDTHLLYADISGGSGSGLDGKDLRGEPMPRGSETWIFNKLLMRCWCSAFLQFHKKFLSSAFKRNRLLLSPLVPRKNLFKSITHTLTLFTFILSACCRGRGHAWWSVGHMTITLSAKAMEVSFLHHTFLHQVWISAFGILEVGFWR